MKKLIDPVLRHFKPRELVAATLAAMVLGAKGTSEGATTRVTESKFWAICYVILDLYWVEILLLFLLIFFWRWLARLCATILDTARGWRTFKTLDWIAIAVLLAILGSMAMSCKPVLARYITNKHRLHRDYSLVLIGRADSAYEDGLYDSAEYYLKLGKIVLQSRLTERVYTDLKDRMQDIRNAIVMLGGLPPFSPAEKKVTDLLDSLKVGDSSEVTAILSRRRADENMIAADYREAVKLIKDNNLAAARPLLLRVFKSCPDYGETSRLLEEVANPNGRIPLREAIAAQELSVFLEQTAGRAIARDPEYEESGYSVPRAFAIGEPNRPWLNDEVDEGWWKLVGQQKAIPASLRKGKPESGTSEFIVQRLEITEEEESDADLNQLEARKVNPFPLGENSAPGGSLETALKQLSADLGVNVEEMSAKELIAKLVFQSETAAIEAASRRAQAIASLFSAAQAAGADLSHVENVEEAMNAVLAGIEPGEGPFAGKVFRVGEEMSEQEKARVADFLEYDATTGNLMYVAGGRTLQARPGPAKAVKASRAPEPKVVPSKPYPKPAVATPLQYPPDPYPTYNPQGYVPHHPGAEASSESHPQPAGASEPSYEVKAGDSLYSIAKKLGVSVQELLAANQLDQATKLAVGDALKVPKTGKGIVKPVPAANKESQEAQAEPSITFPKGRSSGKSGRVISPYPPFNELDVTGLSSGSLAMDPTTQKVFVVP